MRTTPLYGGVGGRQAAGSPRGRRRGSPQPASRVPLRRPLSGAGLLADGTGSRVCPASGPRRAPGGPRGGRAGGTRRAGLTPVGPWRRGPAGSEGGVAAPTPLRPQLLPSPAGAAPGRRVGAGGGAPGLGPVTSTLPWRPRLSPRTPCSCGGPRGWGGVRGAEGSGRNAPASCSSAPERGPATPRGVLPPRSLRPPLSPRRGSFRAGWETLWLKRARGPPRPSPQ